MKKAQTWIITCFYLQLLLLKPLIKAQSPCGNPVTDDVNDIQKLVGNLPKDYMITLKYVRKMDTLNFRTYNDHLYEEGKFFPKEFFKHFYNTIDGYKIFAETPVQSDCVVLLATDPPQNDSSISVTKPFLLNPVAASSLRNDSSGDNSRPAELGFLSSPSMHGISIALTSLVTLFIGFILGALCWKKTTRKHIPESYQATESNICQEDNEISMLQQKEKMLLQV
ncbi:kit ligand isoform X3 [Rhineura floridana]|uniref:kit ligand isoform X3 n=1 Tax=Rhineura floridana TaxID=261503 RepID=UPI002AC81068|nr:kit ligand isoform X3 [Rhineura floridana]